MRHARKRLRLLFLYSHAVTIALVVFVTAAFRQDPKRSFGEIDVERINIVEKDGKLRMVLSNRERQHPGIVDGKTLPRPEGRAPGLLFFNHRGDECGGLIFDENGGKGHFVSLTFDKSRQDQTVGLQHLEGDDGRYFAGLKIWDRPDSSLADFVGEVERIRALPDAAAREAAMARLREQGELGAERIAIGKGRDRSARIALCDTGGRPRITISVDAAGGPRLEFLDETGKVILALPDARPATGR